MITFNLQLAKEIIIKQNDDGTHSIQVKMDVYDEKKQMNIWKEILCLKEQ